MERDDMMILLGEIKADIRSIKTQQGTQGRKLTAIDKRLREQEIRSAKVGGAAGGISGGVISVAVTILLESLKGVARGSA